MLTLFLQRLFVIILNTCSVILFTQNTYTWISINQNIPFRLGEIIRRIPLHIQFISFDTPIRKAYPTNTRNNNSWISSKWQLPVYIDGILLNSLQYIQQHFLRRLVFFLLFLFLLASLYVYTSTTFNGMVRPPVSLFSFGKTKGFTSPPPISAQLYRISFASVVFLV